MNGLLVKDYAMSTSQLPTEGSKELQLEALQAGLTLFSGCFHNNLNTVRSVSVKVQFAKLT